MVLMVEYECIRCGLPFEAKKHKDGLCGMCRTSLHFQAYCKWCGEPVYAENVYKTKFFYNQSNTGYPICDWCSDGLKTNGKISDAEFRKKLGLPPESIEKQKTMDQFFK